MNLGVMAMYTVEEFSFVNNKQKNQRQRNWMKTAFISPWVVQQTNYN